tara:strand:+ start:262 stop:471 length:210 start_codon:yes stop_codon:yes gene_type:complete
MTEILEIHLEIIGKIKKHIEKQLEGDCEKRKALAEEIEEILIVGAGGIPLDKWAKIKKAIDENIDPYIF